MVRYLTKSRFKLALECPTKLYYTKKEMYPDKSASDPFLMALAEGGFQVGELAKLYYPGGVDITTLEYEQSILETQDLLIKENVVIFEAAFKYDNLFIRADIVEKKGNSVTLIEVKSKSFDGDDSEFIGKRSCKITPGWRPYLFDVAFQKYVIQKAYPEYEIKSFLMLANKTAVTTVDGLNQKFQLLKANDDRTYCKVVGNVAPSDLGNEILIRENVDDFVSMIHSGEEKARFQETGFEEWVNMLSDFYARNIKINTAVHKDCGKCQFTCSSEEEIVGKKSGFAECWEARTPMTAKDLKKPLIFELWRGAMGGKDTITNLLDDNIWFLQDIQETYYAPKAGKPYKNLSPTERRTLQIEKCKIKDESPYIDIYGLKDEMSKWKYPLHFIDFETSMVAIPFTKDRRPYEGIAFQFSHHIVEKDGTITHAGQYLDTEQGKFPNFDFMRALKKELEGDNGTIFRYAAHENTYLNMIYQQLGSVSDRAVPDRHVLREFIKTITKSTGKSAEKWEGDRNMVDMLEIVKSFHYDPAMKGSNSIKVVLPAVLNASSHLQQKYSLPICGKGKPVSSLNFDEKVWVEMENGKVKNPYDLLDPIFDGLSVEEMDKFITNEKLADGGAAMTAYARMQFTCMTDLEKDRIVQGLYRYCELDTLAMVFIWEYWMYVK